ncbi:MAG: WXG100 family type VII secretion target [Clostridia bacterium]|nr:WXG100 family type VII secretion target [Clostridia bacterium]MBQ4159003.1 WXG100 family type VII secretion target [Clostridia bacterium]
MAEFDVTLSAMAQAASNISNYTEQFKEEADATYQAAQTLSNGWVGDASQTFVDNMEQLHRWMNELVAVLETYSANLNQARDKYQTTDASAAKNFR